MRVEGLNPEHHRHLGLRRERTCRFFAGHLTIPLWPSEVARACRSLPIGFVRERGTLQAVAITGLRPGENLCIDAAGQWCCDYLPAHVRAHPFRFARRREDGTTPVLALVVDDDAVIGASGVSAGHREALFTEHDEPGPPTQRAMRLFRQLMQGYSGDAVLRECERLGLLVPWEIRTDDPASGRPVHLDGVLRIDESRLNALDDADFLALRRHGGLALLYAHLVSVPALSDLRRQLDSRPERPQDAGAADLDHVVAGDDDELFEFY